MENRTERDTEKNNKTDEERRLLRSKGQSVTNQVGSKSTALKDRRASTVGHDMKTYSKVYAAGEIASSSGTLSKSKTAPLHATKKSTVQKKTEKSAKHCFSQQEIELFEKRYDNGYNLTIDSRYIMWLDSTHLEEAERLRWKDQPVASKDGAIAMKTNPPAGVGDTIEGTSFARRTRTKTQMAAKQCTEQQICKRLVRTNVSPLKKRGETVVKKAVNGNVP